MMEEKELKLEESLYTANIEELYKDYEDCTGHVEWSSIADELFQTQGVMKKYAQRERMLKDKLRTLSNEKMCKNALYVFEFAESRGSIKYNEIPELKGIDLEIYRKESFKRWSLKKI